MPKFAEPRCNAAAADDQHVRLPAKPYQVTLRHAPDLIIDLARADNQTFEYTVYADHCLRLSVSVSIPTPPNILALQRCTSLPFCVPTQHVLMALAWSLCQQPCSCSLNRRRWSLAVSVKPPGRPSSLHSGSGAFGPCCAIQQQQHKQRQRRAAAGRRDARAHATPSRSSVIEEGKYL